MKQQETIVCVKQRIRHFGHPRQMSSTSAFREENVINTFLYSFETALKGYYSWNTQQYLKEPNTGRRTRPPETWNCVYLTSTRMSIRRGRCRLSGGLLKKLQRQTDVPETIHLPAHLYLKQLQFQIVSSGTQGHFPPEKKQSHFPK